VHKVYSVLLGEAAVQLRCGSWKGSCPKQYAVGPLTLCDCQLNTGMLCCGPLSNMPLPVFI
jgi:hypothetical protein